MFKFDFSKDQSENTILKETGKAIDIKWLESKEISPNTIAEESLEMIENCTVNTIKCGDLDIKYLLIKDVISSLKIKEKDNKNSILNAEQNHSDLISGIYEGGLKIWECTYDLMNFINENNLNFDNKRVLDLGCGAGIIGILTLLKNAECYFQDYNSEVIRNITVPNILCNNRENSENQLNKCRFYCGDWKSFLDLIKSDLINENNKFDYIFTSETIYNIENYPKLVALFENVLKRNGVIYLAAKSHYFGVGGGISNFQQFLIKQKTIFDFRTCWKCSDGMKREILKITFKKVIEK